ncbi:glycerophosphodiester phosphodiesterase family protein [Prolixibacteraceae bacterium Z1-6]|uniref:Glycerophosphodiester phosphodiesterase family protein n=1 Tax=Draconibacterium aestuarii TaxID=2998507 RepID=A0A9X3F2Z3_9BACT|nr:glycerophosphodiester phosphodiesterase family protein [Prolixibacteraceae bacterium Z1-6]
MIKSNFKLFILLAILFLSACQTEQPLDKILNRFHDTNSNYVMVAAHRAGHNGYVENSIPAIQHAIDLGVDIIELDVKVTKDSVVVLNHDRTIDRTTTGKGDPEEYTWAELQEFKLKMPDGTITEERLATFEEALKMAKGKAMIDIDIKTGNLKPVADAIKRTGTENQVFFFDNDYDALEEVLTLLPEALLMPRAYSYEMADSAIAVFSPEVIHIDDKFYTSKVVSLIKRNNARVWINSLGKSDAAIRDGKIETAMGTLLQHGANIIQTDEPEIMIPYLKANGLRN